MRDPDIHRRVLERVAVGLSSVSLGVQKLCVSPIHGAKGNIEFFMLARAGAPACSVDLDAVVDEAWSAASPEPEKTA